MNNEMLVVMLIISPLVGVIIGYMVSYIQINRRRKSAVTVDKDTKKLSEDMEINVVEIPWSILKIDKKAAALKSIREFRERVMPFSPIELINGVEVTVIKNTSNKTIDRVTHKQYTQELSCLKIKFYLDGVYHCETIYNQYTFPHNEYHVNGYEKYSLEELQGYDWIINEMFNIVEEKKKQIHKEKLKDIEVKYSILSHDLVKK